SPPQGETSATVPAAEPKASPPRGYAGALEVGGGAALNQHTRALGQGALLIRVFRGPYRLEGGALSRWFAPPSVRGARGSVDENEWALGLSLRALRSVGARFEVGVYAEPLWGVLSARGTTVSGTRGEQRLGRFSLTLGLDARVRLFASTFLRFAPAID